ncbi:MAG: hypothetical protein ACOCVF_00810 [bacterium]
MTKKIKIILAPIIGILFIVGIILLFWGIGNLVVMLGFNPFIIINYVFFDYVAIGIAFIAFMIAFGLFWHLSYNIIKDLI